MASTVDTNIALISLDNLKEYLQITASTEDALLAAIINGISQRVHDYCQRNLLSKQYTQYYSGRGTSSFMLAMAPVTAVSKIYEDSLRAFGASSEVAVADRIVEPCGRVTAYNNRTLWNRGTYNIKVVYTAGYASAAALPASIALAVKEFCAAAYYKAKNKRFDVQSESLGDKNITYTQVDMPPQVEGALQPYVLPPSGEDWCEEVAGA